MKTNKNIDGKIIRRVLENDDLTDKRAASLISDLNTLGDMAESFAPKPLKTIEFKTDRTLWSVYLRPAMAGGITFMVIAIAVITLYRPETPDLPVNLDAVYSEIEMDTLLMAEIDTLVESVSYNDIYPDSENDESTYDFSDEFMEAVVPI